MTTLEIIEKCAYTGALLFGFLMIVYLLIRYMISKAQTDPEDAVIVTEHRILLNHKIANIRVEEDDVFFIYE